MTRHTLDGSAGDVDYGRFGDGYARYRRPEPEIAAIIVNALGVGSTVLNVGAGAGSYEPVDRTIIAVEPSAAMRTQRSPSLATTINAVAEWLPFKDQSFDAAMATFTVHQWPDLEQGLAEMRRVAARCVVLTCDPELVRRFWLTEYAPEVVATEARRYPSIARIRKALGDDAEVTAIPIPLHCADGFAEAYYGRPEMFLDAGTRLANSAWSFVDSSTAERYVQHLRQDIESGAWDARHGLLRRQTHFTGSLVIITSG